MKSAGGIGPIVAIATIGEAEELPLLINGLRAHEHEWVYLLSNSNDELGRHLPPSTETAYDPIRIDMPGVNLYAVWNEALRLGREQGRRVAILNDDITLHGDAIGETNELMDRNPEYAVVGLDYQNNPHHHGVRKVHGSYRHGGVNGAAFLVDPTVELEFDERFEWWYGDDDFFLGVEKLGRYCGIADGCCFRHRGEGTSRNHPWTQAAKVRDRARFVEKWGPEV